MPVPYDIIDLIIERSYVMRMDTSYKLQVASVIQRYTSHTASICIRMAMLGTPSTVVAVVTSGKRLILHLATVIVTAELTPSNNQTSSIVYRAATFSEIQDDRECQRVIVYILCKLFNFAFDE